MLLIKSLGLLLHEQSLRHKIDFVDPTGISEAGSGLK